MTAASYFLFRTETGRQLIDLRQLAATGQDARAWVAHHRFAAPFIFLTLYVACALLVLPVWWLQVLSGYAWGLGTGLAWSLAGHATASVTVLYFSRWLGGEWARTRAGHRMAKLQRLSQRLGHRGLLVVIAARVCYVVPYSLSNYLFGLTHIRARDAALGSLIGGLPISAGYVAVGARPALLTDWRFWAAVVGINLLLLGPVAVRFVVARMRRRPVVPAGPAAGPV
jgi:uncharacterized membrane protein YdjX (TVP38/TMEM64 family)